MTDKIRIPRKSINPNYPRVMYLEDIPRDAELFENSQDIAACISDTGIPKGFVKSRVTGVCRLLNDGEIVAIWYTMDNAHYATYAQYEQCPIR